MWSSSKEMKVTEMSWKVTSSVLDNDRRPNLLKRSKKTSMSEFQETVRDKRSSKDPIVLPWKEKKPKTSDLESSDQKVPDSQVSEEVPLYSPVSDTDKEKVVIELKWIEKAEAPEEKPEGTQASLTSVDAEKTNSITALPEAPEEKPEETQASLGPMEAEITNNLSAHLETKVITDEKTLPQDAYTQDCTQEKVLNTNQEEISQIGLEKSDLNVETQCHDQQKTSGLTVTTHNHDQQYTPNELNDTHICIEVSTHDTDLHDASSTASPVTSLPANNNTSTVNSVTRILTRIRSTPARDIDLDTIVLPSELNRGIRNDMIKPRYPSISRDIPIQGLSHRQNFSSKLGTYLDPKESSAYITKSFERRKRQLANLDNDSLSFSSSGSSNFSSSEFKGHDDVTTLLEYVRRDLQASRESTPFTRSPVILTEIKEEQDIGGDIIAEAELLATYHGAGVLSPLTTDDIPDQPSQDVDFRRERSVSIMRRLLSDGGSSGQLSRESTPMSDLRRRFKVKMKMANLHEAASTGDINTLTSLLEAEEVDINATDEKEKTALHFASDRGHLEAVSMLIAKGGKVNLADADSRTPLHFAVESGEPKVVEALLAAGADVDVQEKSRGRTPIHLATVSNSLDVLKVLIQPMIDDPWEARKTLKLADKDGRTLLHMTAHHGLQEATSLLLTAGAEVNATDFSGNTPMHAVILTRLRRKERICAPLLEVLLDSGGDVEGGGGGIEGGDAGTLMHAAASVGCLDCLRVLVNRSANMEAKDSFGKTPLHIAIEEERLEAVAFLLENKASMEQTDTRGQRALHHAIMTDSPSLIDVLLNAGADKSAKDRDGYKYFQYALLKRRYQALNSLVKNGVTEVGDDQKASHFCASVGNQVAIDVLLNNEYNINEVDKEGRTALHHAISSGHEALVLHLLANGSSSKRADNNGATPLHYAVRWGGSDALLRRLVKMQGNVGAVDRLGRTPLHYAASKSSIMSDMYILINNGAHLNTKDDRGLTPLHLAARLGNESLVRILLDNDARHDIRDCDDFLPIDHAKEKGHKCIIKRLEAYHIKKEREKEARLDLYVGKNEGQNEAIM